MRFLFGAIQSSHSVLLILASTDGDGCALKQTRADCGVRLPCPQKEHVPSATPYDIVCVRHPRPTRRLAGSTSASPASAKCTWRRSRSRRRTEALNWPRRRRLRRGSFVPSFGHRGWKVAIGCSRRSSAWACLSKSRLVCADVCLCRKTPVRKYMRVRELDPRKEDFKQLARTCRKVVEVNVFGWAVRTRFVAEPSLANKQGCVRYCPCGSKVKRHQSEYDIPAKCRCSVRIPSYRT